MILTALLSFFAYIISIVLSLLPSSTGLNSGIQTALTSFMNYANLFNFIFPVDVLIEVFIATIVFTVIYFGYDISMWILGFFKAHSN